MWRDTPDQRLSYIKQRQNDLMAQAAAERSVGRRNQTLERFTGLHLRLGKLLIVVGRTICEDDAMRPGLIR